MTIKDTIPTWVKEWTLKGNRMRFENKLIEERQAFLFVDSDYVFSSFGPAQNDRYYFKIKLKKK